MVEVDIRRTTDGILVLSHDVDLSGNHLVTLDELLVAVPRVPLNLEIKNLPGEPRFEPDHRLALETAAKSRAGDLLTCFFWPTVDEVRIRYPGVATGLLMDLGGSVTDAAAHALHHGHGTLVLNWQLALSQPNATRSAADAGLRLVVWTLNDPGRVPALAELGVDAIITDDPGRMSTALAGQTFAKQD